ncbi:aldehyde ferredoxin oxidoreductase C-terminal domain-containing protein [Thermodesulfovibrio sp. TK110]
MFNYRECFRRDGNWLPDRFFEDALTIGPKKSAVLDKEIFREMLTQYYKKRSWTPKQ